MKRRCLFLDRDGVVNREIGYLSRWDDVELVPGIVSLCLAAQRLSYELVIVTNQSGIARGLYSEADFVHLTDQFRRHFATKSVYFGGVYYCPYHPEHGVGAYRREHEDRKPSPGMLLRAAADLELDLGASVMVGDRCSDVGAANAAGLRQAFLLAGTEAGPCPGSYLSIASLKELEDWLVRDAAEGAE